MSKEESTPYSFKGDNAKLVDSIKSLLALDSKGALVPNGVCGLARQLLESAAERLAVETQPAAWIKPDVLATLRKDECCYAFGEQSPKGNLVPLFTRSDAGEVESLREAYVAAGEREHALREELAAAKRNEHNSEVAYKAAIEKQDELRGDLARMTEGRDGLRLALDEANKVIAWQRDEKPDLAELASLRAALKFYADRDHYSTDDGLNWDSVSGEPMNILWHEEQPWFIEDGSVARAALSAGVEPTKAGAV
jgi:hypothetical protein